MRRFDTLLFDVDGTLIDSEPGIIACFEHTFRTLGIPYPEDIKKFLGPSLQFSFREYCGLTGEKNDEAVAVSRKKYRSEGIFDASAFEGVEEMLKRLSDMGLQLAAATCKLETLANVVLDHFGIAKYFRFIGGTDEVRTEKSEVIAHVLEELGMTDTSRVLMIGDRDNDIKGAKKLDIPCLYALWGYGTREEAEENGAIDVAETPMDCVNLLRKMQHEKL